MTSRWTKIWLPRLNPIPPLARLVAKLGLPGTKSAEGARHAAHAVSFGTVVIVVAVLIAVNSWGRAIESQVGRRLLFGVRAMLTSPELDPRIKIFSFDDRTAAALKDFDLSLEDWATVLGALTERQPRIVIVDKIFDKFWSPSEKDTFVDASKTWKAPVANITFVHPGVISWREIFDAQAQQALIPRTENLPRWLKGPSQATAYGTQMPAAFHTSGHTVYNGDGLTRLVWKTSGPAGAETHVGHLALAAASELVWNRDRLTAEGHSVPTTGSGDVVINFHKRDTYVQKAWSMLAVVERAKRGLDIPVVSPGDIVIILPGMYTGNTDWRETPLGSMPGGYHLVALINSVLTGDWLRKVEDYGIFALLAGLVGLGCGLALPPTQLVLTLVALGTATSGIALAGFMWAGVVVDWTVPLAAIMVNALIGWSARSRAVQLEMIRMARELETAELVQGSFLPVQPVIQGVNAQVRGWFKPATECGGDWWGHMSWNDEWDYVFIGDAVGHGVPAALVTAVSFTIKSAFDSRKKDGPPPEPSEILSAIDMTLVRMRSRYACMSMQIVRIKRGSGCVEVTNAGHTMAMIVPANPNDPRLKEGQRVKTVLVRGTLLGQDTPLDPGTKVEPVSPGDRIVLYTDGIIENCNKQQKPMTRPKLLEFISQETSQPLMDVIINAHQKWVEGTAPEDDATVVVLTLN
jgi:serine phosphatase RsbU (regulator of sigma subunit)